MIGKNQGVGQGSTEKMPGRLDSGPILTVPDACIADLFEAAVKSIDCARPGKGSDGILTGPALTIDNGGFCVLVAILIAFFALGLKWGGK